MDAETWWESQWAHGSRMRLEAIAARGGPAALEKLKREAFERLTAFAEPEGIPERSTALLCLARRP